MAGGETSSSPPHQSALSGEQWAICISAAAVFLLVLVVNFALQNARRWRALSDIKLDVVPPGFRTLQDLPRVRSFASSESSAWLRQRAESFSPPFASSAPCPGLSFLARHTSRCVTLLWPSRSASGR
jgi:hypothetical protein